MICEKYESLTITERVRLIGSVTHCLQSDNTLFVKICKIIEEGNRKGVLDGVTFLPDYDILDIEIQ